MAMFIDSRYVNTGVYAKNGVAILNIRARYHFNSDTMTYYTFVAGDTLDGIADRQYGNPAFWWAIMDANPVYQSEIEISPGDVLAIPALEEVVAVSGG